ncbi:MAG: NADH-quinone oxidoreductase chain e [candidate division TA06 bacterium 32_111]|uniref:NADH-quinone oxidoreductase chain e n=2 Tax=Bacteria candidate phyla TaxID=1783234 RepID=A0A124G072_UNCT6|nr:MAG: NADH-quinone oxidoreductase chain e [candidate division TA06 bacterium 32_111]KUK86545.1 MAG: NADH-quinone oxidoreductase chain e [candidate division TA06 bacterium 34_109]
MRKNVELVFALKRKNKFGGFMNREEILKKYEPTRENLLYILHDIQDSKNEKYLSEEDLVAVSRYLKISRSEVVGVATFYTMFSVKKRGQHIIRVCVSPPCQLMGGNTIFNYLRKTLGVKEGETTSDNMFTLESSSCLGVCAVAPAMMIDDQMFGNLTPEKIDEIITRYREKKNG